MGKPSIFSRDYERKMKKRRRMIFLAIGVVILLFSVAWLFGKGKSIQFDKISSFFDNKKQEKSHNDMDNKKSVIENKKDEDKDENKEENKEKETKNSNGYEIKLSDGKKIKLMYEEENGDKKFKYIYPVESKVKYDISPSTNKRAIIYDEKAQKIILVDINGNVSDLTNLKYISTNGSVAISHDEKIQATPDYIWCNDPKFIDEDNIAYVSQLPWLNKSTKYIWMVNVTNKTHTYVQNISGEELIMDKISDKGLKILVDGNELFLKSNGDVVQ